MILISVSQNYKMKRDFSSKKERKRKEVFITMSSLFQKPVNTIS